MLDSASHGTNPPDGAARYGIKAAARVFSIRCLVGFGGKPLPNGNTRRMCNERSWKLSTSLDELSQCSGGVESCHRVPRGSKGS